MRKQFTILVADDNTLMRGTLKMIIDRIKEVSFIGDCSNGEEIIALAKKRLPDIILMDINMSPINGFEATRKILKEHPAIKIIGLSMHNKASYAKNMLKLGAVGYVCKSSTHNEIIEAIKKVAGGGKYIDKNLVGKVDI
jgi:two-component system, NarL family, invasion response regulator UvrY